MNFYLKLNRDTLSTYINTARWISVLSGIETADIFFGSII